MRGRERDKWEFGGENEIESNRTGGFKIRRVKITTKEKKKNQIRFYLVSLQSPKPLPSNTESQNWRASAGHVCYSLPFQYASPLNNIMWVTRFVPDLVMGRSSAAPPGETQTQTHKNNVSCFCRNRFVSLMWSPGEALAGCVDVCECVCVSFCLCRCVCVCGCEREPVRGVEKMPIWVKQWQVCCFYTRFPPLHTTVELRQQFSQLAHTHFVAQHTHTHTHKHGFQKQTHSHARASNPRTPCKSQEEAVIILPEELAGCNLKR